MERTFLSGITVGMAIVAAGHGLAESPEAEKMLAMTRNIEFITQNSSLEYAGQALPDVAIVTGDELQSLFHAAAVQDFSFEEKRPFRRVSAFYDRYANKIFLADANSVAGPGLFHELVHFLQTVNGKDDMFQSHRACLEAEAYELQAIWQADQGIDPVSRPAYGFVMTLYGVCNDADFSWIGSY